MNILHLTKGQKEYRCSCNRTIPKGELHLNLGHGYRGRSRGRACLECIMRTADEIRGGV